MPVPRRRRRWTVEHLESRALLSAIPATIQVERPAVVDGRVAANVVYTTSGSPQSLNVYLPNGAAPAGGWPVVVVIHGGGWRRFNKEQYARKVARPLVESGFAVVAPDYQLSTPRVPSWPGAFQDVRQVVRWIRTHATAYAFNPTRIAAMGESAGGHLAALLGTNPDGPVNLSAQPLALPRGAPGAGSARIEAVIDFFGPVDLAVLDHESSLARLPVEQFLGATPEQAPGRYAAASPVKHVAVGDPPMLILQGSADPVVPVDQSRELAAALTAAGVRNRLEILPGASHGFGFSTGGQNLLLDVVTFLRSALGLT